MSMRLRSTSVAHVDGERGAIAEAPLNPEFAEQIGGILGSYQILTPVGLTQRPGGDGVRHLDLERQGLFSAEGARSGAVTLPTLAVWRGGGVGR